MNRLALAVSTIVGTVIGAGILGIPYAVSKSGIIIGIIHLIGIGLFMMLLHLLLGEITLRVPGKHQLPGYAGKILGNKGKILMTFAHAFGIYGALAAYAIGITASLDALGFAASVWTVFLALCLFCLLNSSFFEKAELGLSMGKILFGLLIIILAFLSKNFSINTASDTSMFFAPYGIIFFSYLGTVSIPEVKALLSRNTAQVKTAIMIGSAIPIILYIFFTIAVIGLGNVSELATISVGNALGSYGKIFINIFAILALFSAFLALSFSLRHAFEYDYKLNMLTSWMLVMVPASLFLLYSSSFSKVLHITGALSSILLGSLILMMHQRAQKIGDPDYEITVNRITAGIIILMLIAGAYVSLISW